jgi:hypothetical protein
MSTSLRTSSDNIEYSVAATPTEINLHNIQYGGKATTADGYSFHHFFVPCEELRQCGLPLDANPREPTRASVVKDMALTLTNHPSLFHHWNNGITVVCDGLIINEQSAKIRFEEGSGICNGGHTYFTIVTFPTEIPEQALVHIEVIAIPSGLTPEQRKHSINDIARNRNANRALLPSTQADFLGYYTPFKSALGIDSSMVKWHEGDSSAESNAIASETLIRMLAALDPLWFQHPIHSPAKPNHRNAATGSGTIHSRWYDNQKDPEANLAHMAPLTKDAFRIADIISYNLRHADMATVGGNFRNTLFYRDWLKGGNRDLRFYKSGLQGDQIPNPALIMMLGAFRSNVWIAKDELGNPSLIGMIMNPEALWQESFGEYLRSLSGIFSDSDQNPSIFIKANSPYDSQLLTISYGRRPPENPLYFHDLSNGVKYTKADADNATHILEYSEGYGSLSSLTSRGSEHEALYMIDDT